MASFEEFISRCQKPEIRSEALAFHEKVKRCIKRDPEAKPEAWQLPKLKDELASWRSELQQICEARHKRSLTAEEESRMEELGLALIVADNKTLMGLECSSIVIRPINLSI